jgi:hypothetical protein
MAFETVNYGTWLEKVRGSEEDVKNNPSRKLLDFWEGTGYGDGGGEG